MPDLTALRARIAAATGPFVKINENPFLDAQPAAADKNATGYEATIKMVQAWPSVAFDAVRFIIVAFGGGHGNYSGAELIKYLPETMRWTLGCLPPKTSGVSTNNGWVNMPMIDTPPVQDISAPGSCHTYHRNLVLPVSGRFMTFCGPTFNYQGGPVIPNGSGGVRGTGPYTLDLDKLDPTKTAGANNGGVQPGRLGTGAWKNRDRPDLQQIGQWFGLRGLNGTDRVTVCAAINGVDVIWTTGVAEGNQWLTKYVIRDADNSATDCAVIAAVNSNCRAMYGAAGLDPVRGWMVGLNDNGTGFTAYKLSMTVPPIGSTPDGRQGANNSNPLVQQGVIPPNGGETVQGGYNLTVTGTMPANAPSCGMDFDPIRGHFRIIDVSGNQWTLTRPASGVLTDSWALVQIVDVTTLPLAMRPTPKDIVSGVRGCFGHMPGLDGFYFVDGNGDNQFVKPADWVNEGDPPPPPPPITVTVTPTTASLVTGATQAFSASVAGSSNQEVGWDVNGIAGGNAALGTVSAAGLYTAPAAVPDPATVTLRAVAAANGTSSDTADITISAEAPPPPPPPVSKALSFTVNVGAGDIPGLAAGTLTVTGTASGFTFTPEV